MKNKLFAVAMVVLLYSFFVLAFTVADTQGMISQVLTKAGLSNDAAVASSSSGQAEVLESDVSPSGNLIDPMPEPIRPRPKPRS